MWISLAKILNTDHWAEDLENIEDEGDSTVKPRVLYKTYVSGGDDGEFLYLFDDIPTIPSHGLNVIEYAYSRHHINSTQGEFEINNGHKLYHTEPKSLSNILESLKASYSDIIVISRLEMCPCCSRLLIGTFQSKREGGGSFPNNFFVISKNILEDFKEQNVDKIKQFLQALKEESLNPALFDTRKRDNMEKRIFQHKFRSIDDLKTFLFLPSLDIDALHGLYTCLRIHMNIEKIEEGLAPHGGTHNTLAQLVYEE